MALMMMMRACSSRVGARGYGTKRVGARGYGTNGLEDETAAAVVEPVKPAVVEPVKPVLVVKFKIPPKGFYGLNCDGGHGAKDHPNMSVIGGIVRDSDCKWQYGYNQLYPSSDIRASNISERDAMLKGLPICVEKKIRKLIVYSDFKHLIDALNNPEKLANNWDNEALLKILGFKDSFDILQFEHVPKQGNRAAHCLAKMAYKHLNYEGKSFDEPPPGEDELLQILEDDKNQVGIVRK